MTAMCILTEQLLMLVHESSGPSVALYPGEIEAEGTCTTSMLANLGKVRQNSVLAENFSSKSSRWKSGTNQGSDSRF